MIGTRVGDWLITEELGDGGHAFVFKGVRDGEVAAIKMLKPSVASEENLEKRFKIEVEALKNLDHSAIVGFKDYFFTGGYHYLILEYMDAGAIDHLLRVNGALEPRYALPIIYMILDGMSFAHSFGYIHRDVKPNNILLNKQGEAKVTDFGIAKVVGGEDLTKQGFVLGTTLYMAPEYLSQGVVTPQTDIYALGVLLYEMLTNRKPFEFETDDEPLVSFAKRVCTMTPAPPSAYRPIPPALEKIIMKAIARDPKKRYRQVEKLQADLNKAFPDLVARPIEIPDGRPKTNIARMPESVAANASRASGARLSRPLVLAVSVIATVLVGFVAALVLEQEPGPSSVAGLLFGALVMGMASMLERRRHAPISALTDVAPDAPADDSSDPLPFHGGVVPQGEVEETNISELSAYLEVTEGEAKGKRYGVRPISRIGRDLRFDIRPHDPEISRHHAMITFTGFGFVVKDTGSTNGTFVNEVKVELGAEADLNHGDILRAGRTSMKFEHQRTG
jgi:serine/threonine-protein kinase